jgi:probable F420-dependent oxidoreductase
VNLGRVGVWSAAFDQLAAREVADLVRQIEDLGYGTVWCADSRGREAIAQAGFLLAQTATITVATGVTSMHARTAETAAKAHRTLTEAYPDRFLLGLGVSHRESVETNHGRPYDADPVGAMRSYLDTMDAVSWIGPEPPVTPVRMLAALGPQMLALAAERSAGAHTFLVPLAHTEWCRAQLGPGPWLAPVVTAVLERDPAAARARARAIVVGVLRMDNYRRHLRRLGYEDVDGDGSDQLVDDLVVWGDAGAVAARIEGHLRAGADHVALNLLSSTAEDLAAGWRAVAGTAGR